MNDDYVEFDDPSQKQASPKPEEIAERAAQIRKGWKGDETVTNDNHDTSE